MIYAAGLRLVYLGTRRQARAASPGVNGAHRPVSPSWIVRTAAVAAGSGRGQRFGRGQPGRADSGVEPAMLPTSAPAVAHAGTIHCTS
jgi:hypothetical protein